jgi:repressor LexA
MPTINKTLRILEFIKGSILVNGEPPTIREIGEAFNMSSSASVAAHIKKMEQRGLILRIPNISRGIRLTGQERKEAA